MADTSIVNLVAFTGAFFVALIFMPLVLFLAKKFKVLATQDFRRKQETPVPLMGGLAIFAAFAVMCATLGLDSLTPFFLAGLPLLVIGLLDDKIELNPQVKFMAQVASVSLWLWLVPSDNIVLSQIGAPQWFSVLMTGFWIIGLINALNMLDGMDGEASGVAIIVAIVISMMTVGQTSQAMVAFAGACAGFLFYNFPPAKIYLGESGSTLLGFFLATSSITISVPTAHNSMILIPLFLLAVPEVDAVMAIIRRRFAKSSALQGDQDHIHHKLRKTGFSIRQSLLFLYGATIYSGVTALTIFYLNGSPISWMVGALSTVGLLVLLGAILYLENRQAHQVSRLSQTIIGELLPIDESSKFDTNNFHACVYDLLPYYKEMQNRGVSQVHEFIQDFGVFLEENHPEGQLRTVGSYSVIVIQPRQAKEIDFRNHIAEEYFEFLAQQKVQKNADGLPWGLSFYSTESNAELFLEKFALSGSTSRTSGQKKAS